MSDKEIFDKKFVYLEWDDALEGKEGFFSRDMATLKVTVNEGSVCVPAEIRCVYSSCSKGSLARPFHSEREEDNWVFFYYDPLYDIKRAWKEGKQIQSRSKVWRDAEWEDDDYPQWNNQSMEFRVRPKGFVPKKKWRPFKDIEELKQTWEKKFDPLVHPELFEPMIWVRSKSNTTSTYLISHFCGNVGVVHIYSSLDTSLEQLYEDFTFLDGTPCGVEE